MGIFDAMTTAVGGMSSQSYALENISGNIANSQSTGYKRTDSSFSDMVGGGSVTGHEIAGGVVAYSRATNASQGSITTSNVSTNMAINGTGYFVVQAKVVSSTGSTAFSGVNLYTRRGDFSVDKDGYLKNGAGYYLMGYTVNAATGSISSSIPTPVQVDTSFMAATASTSITYNGNLPSVPQPSRYDSSNPATELLNSATTGLSDISSANEAAFLASSIDGGSVTCYDSLGSPVNVQTRWAKVTNADATTIPVTKDKWQLYYATGSSTSPWAVVGTTSGTATQFSFNTDGTLASPSPATISQPNLTVNGNNLGSINFDFTGGLTQSYTSTHTPTLTMDQNGNSAGTSATVSIDSNGRVQALFNNGQTKTLSQIPLATFSGAAFLRKKDGGAFAATTESGSPSINASSNFVGGSLESSNVDVSEEFSKLIVTQQAYSANTKIISTANTMMQDTINIIR